MSGETLVLERSFGAPPEAVFDAWTSEEVLRRWFAGQPGWDTPLAEVDLRVGGELRIVMRDPVSGKEHGGGGSYTEIDRPRRLAFTWAWDSEADHEMSIEVEFEPAGAGATRMRFTHGNLLDEASVRNHEEGWSCCFDNLERALAEDVP